MCEDCEEAEPLYVAYFGKAGGNLWRPRQEGALRDRQVEMPVVRERFACDDLRETKVPWSIQRKSG